MAATKSPEDIEIPGLGLTVELGLFVLMEGIASYFAFGLGLYLGDYLGSGFTVEMAGGIGLLFCYGVVKTWLNVRLLAMDYRGDLTIRWIGDDYSPVVFPRESLKAVVWGGSEPPRQNDSPSKIVDPRLLAGLGLGLPLFIVATLSVNGNPYLVFLIPVVAYGVHYGLGRSGPEPIRQRPYHVGLALTLTYSYIPIILALLLFLYWAILPAVPDLFPYSVAYHFWYSPMHIVILPLAMLPVVYVSNYCLLLGYDSYRARKGILPEFASEDAETTTDVSAGTRTDETDADGDMSQLLWAFAPVVPVNAVIVAWAYGFRPVAAVGAGTVPLLIIGVVLWLDDVPVQLGDAGSIVAGTAGGLVACAIASAVPLLYTSAGPYRYAVWLPVGALVGFVTGVLLYAAVESGDRTTARSG